MSAEFTDEQVERYSRHILLPEIGVAGQRRLAAASAFIIGAGGLGSPALLYLAAAGVGRIGIADGDTVDLSNLQRQIIHDTNDLGKNKGLSARESLAKLNPDCKVEVFAERVTAGTIRETIAGYDVVLDGSDNFPTRFMVADCCWFEKIPLVSAAVLRFEGQLLTVLPGDDQPCYRCLMPTMPPPKTVPTCGEAGILGAVAGVMGTLQATEALKVILNIEAAGHGRQMDTRFLIYDALDCSFRTMKRRRDSACPLCGDAPTITTLVGEDFSCANESTPPS